MIIYLKKCRIYFSSRILRFFLQSFFKIFLPYRQYQLSVWYKTIIQIVFKTIKRRFSSVQIVQIWFEITKFWSKWPIEYQYIGSHTFNPMFNSFNSSSQFLASKLTFLRSAWFHDYKNFINCCKNVPCNISHG